MNCRGLPGLRLGSPRPECGGLTLIWAIFGFCEDYFSFLLLCFLHPRRRTDSGRRSAGSGAGAHTHASDMAVGTRRRPASPARATCKDATVRSAACVFIGLGVIAAVVGVTWQSSAAERWTGSSGDARTPSWAARGPKVTLDGNEPPAPALAVTPPPPASQSEPALRAQPSEAPKSPPPDPMGAVEQPPQGVAEAPDGAEGEQPIVGHHIRGNASGSLVHNPAPWRRLWDPLLATQPEPACVSSEYLGTSISDTPPTVLCRANTSIVGPSGVGAYCTQRPGQPVKYCEVIRPVIERVHMSQFVPFVLPRCALVPSKLTTSAKFAVLPVRPATGPHPSDAAGDSDDDEWLLTVHRDCGPPRNNPYHCTADVVSAYLAIRAVGADPKRVRIVLTGRFDLGPYAELWRSIGGAGVHSSEQWEALLLNETWAMPRFRSLLVPMVNPSGPLWYHYWMFTPCKRASPLLLELRGLMLASALDMGPADSLATVRRRFGEGCTIPYSPQLDGTGPVVTIASRVKSAAYKRHGMQRQLANEAEIVARLRKELPKGVRVQAVDLSTLSWPEQMRVIHNTTVLLGMHGAALTWSMFMEPGGAMVELHEYLGDKAPPKGMGNIASHTGLAYYRWRATTPGPEPWKGTRADASFVVSAVQRGLQEARRFCQLVEGHAAANGGWDALTDQSRRPLALPSEPAWQPVFDVGSRVNSTSSP